jgi:O-antigen ligase
VPTPGELFSLLTNPQALYSSINWQGRTTSFWPVVWTGFMAAPVTGLGLGSSSYIIAQHFPTYAANVAHNEYLRLAADTGVIGVSLFTLAMFTWLFTMLRCARSRSAESAEYASAAVAGIIGWAIIALTDNPFDSYMYFTQYVGLLVGAAVAASARVAWAEPGYTARQ